ncbi:MAG: phage tail protein [Methylobacter sp.]|nr:MAG: phage tail protein [Methylobacter sp.]PPD03365.1 MAG: phage tail protein [Methylobacter sp.]PPD23598.1 MAG: phage tail protein [Methylobacter sp.]
MSEPFIGEIRSFGFNFAPKGWLPCNGQLLTIAQNTALFSILGTTYGGDGRTNFALPNLNGNVAMGAGQGAGLTPRVIGETGGVESVTLLESQIPAHTHPANCNNANGNQYGPAGHFWAQDAAGGHDYSDTATGQMASGTIQPAGGNQAHTNLQPYLVLNYCIATQGIFPPRS